MAAHPRRIPGPRWWVGLAAAGYAVAAAFTHPFTTTADVVTALPVVAAVPMAAVGMRHPHPHADAAPTAASTPWSRWWMAWPVLGAAVVTWELVTFVSAPRSAHPTLSALLDMLDAHAPGKTAAFAVWLALGWFLATR